MRRIEPRRLEQVKQGQVAGSKRVERMTPGEVLLDPKPPGLSAEQALHIARLDAEAAYGDLDDFRITIARQPDGWHIDYELLDAMRDGGGPHYVIDARSGKILAKRYEQ